MLPSGNPFMAMQIYVHFIELCADSVRSIKRLCTVSSNLFILCGASSYLKRHLSPPPAIPSFHFISFPFPVPVNHTGEVIHLCFFKNMTLIHCQIGILYSIMTIFVGMPVWAATLHGL